MNTTGTLARTVTLIAVDNGTKKVTEIRTVPAGTVVYLSGFAGRDTTLVTLPGTLLQQRVSLDAVALT